MENHLKIELSIQGNILSALADALEISKTLKSSLRVFVPEAGINILVSPESYLNDLVQIVNLSIKIKELKEIQGVGK